MIPPIATVLAATVAPIDETEATRTGGRIQFLDQRTIALGRAWATQCRDDLQREGRPAAGGWPGTIREARSQVAQGLQGEMVRRKMAALTEAEHEAAVRSVYAHARAEWRRHMEPEEP